MRKILNMIRGSDVPAPLLADGQPVDWWFAYKFSTQFMRGCGDGCTLPGTGAFGGSQQYYVPKGEFGLQYVVASSKNPSLTKGPSYLGSTKEDPLGATFAQVYNGNFNYVIWNDAFQCDPMLTELSFPWAHSKGFMCWNDDGDGFVTQVTTPSWPGSGSSQYPRMYDGNTLGYVKENNVLMAQHFFSLRLCADDVEAVLQALINSGAVTNPLNRQLVRSGGPSSITDLVSQLGGPSKATDIFSQDLSVGNVKLVTKPSSPKFFVPPWQMISAQLDSLPLRVATWWTGDAEIPSLRGDTPMLCWHDQIGKPGDVEIATSGTWDGKKFNLSGGIDYSANHAKIGVSTDASRPYCIFGDLNQVGAFSPNIAYEGQTCETGQNERGGLFFAMQNQGLFESLTQFMAGDTAPFFVPPSGQ